jgi:hypothetical protein
MRSTLGIQLATIAESYPDARVRAAAALRNERVFVNIGDDRAVSDLSSSR